MRLSALRCAARGPQARGRESLIQPQHGPEGPFFHQKAISRLTLRRTNGKFEDSLQSGKVVR